VSAIELETPLSPDECEARLRAVVGADLFVSWFSTRPVVGWVSGRSVRLRKRIGYRNSFQTFLTGTLYGQAGGTVFRGQAGTHPLVRGFLAVWFGGVILIGSALMVAAVAGRLTRGSPLLGVAIPPLLLAFGFGVFRLGRWLARGEERFLVAFLAETIGAGAERAAEPAPAPDRAGGQ
jgi:hypothetical protein